MKDKLKLLLKWAVTFCFCFIVIYSFVFCGGWRLFKSSDPIGIELGVAFVLSIFVLIFSQMISTLEHRVKELEERVNVLKKSNQV